MTTDFIRTQIKVAMYSKKLDTKHSYYREDGETPLPNRLDVALGNVITTSANKGRMISGEPVVGEVKGSFKIAEKSTLKKYAPFKIHSKIFRNSNFPHLAGVATIAISGEDGKISKEKEEGILVFVEKQNKIQTYFMAGECYPSRIDEVCAYVSETLEKGEV